MKGGEERAADTEPSDEVRIVDTTDGALGLFGGVGIEIEYMIVDADDLAVRPITDQLIAQVAGHIVPEIERGPLAWSNELVLHVVELKTNGPAARVDPALLGALHSDVETMNDLLAEVGCRLMPTAMHPFMDPLEETVLWPHGYNHVYRAYDRIFGCQGHGWSNLQSMHLNFPFDGDEEFGRLHAGIRLLLPLLPALCASSPVVEGRLTDTVDNRMAFYRTNSAKVPSLTGAVVPERVFDEASYRAEIFDRMDEEIGPLDPQRVLVGQPFLNARGAIARFDRGAIEIRVIDSQECVRADLAVATLVGGVLRLLTSDHWTDQDAQRAWSEQDLAAILTRTVARGERAVLDDPGFLELLGFGAHRATAGELWSHLLASAADAGTVGPSWTRTLDDMLRHGPLARRIRIALGNDGDGPSQPDSDRVAEVYSELCDCLRSNILFGV